MADSGTDTQKMDVDNGTKDANDSPVGNNKRALSDTKETQDSNDARTINCSNKTSSNNNNNNNNSNNGANKKRKPSKSHTWRQDLDKKGSDKPPHDGSYANEAQRTLSNVSIDDRTPFDVDKTVKRKVAMFLGFIGTRYAGFQINAEQRTLQAELELALYKAGMINETNFGYPFKYAWGNSARTDKGVHACAQVCSLKIETPEAMVDDSEAIRERLQSHLPNDIQILDIVRTTRAFCAKTQRDRVRYQYMLPSFVLHPDPRSLFARHNIPVDGRKDMARQPLSAEEVKALMSDLRSYRSATEQRQLLQDALSKYVGTHSFHNFTKGIRYGEATANRYIVSFHVQEPIIVDGIEWIPTQVVGQAFLLHQIRKMICLAMDVARGVASVGTVSKALGPGGTRVNVAPAQGLFLEFSWYDAYNKKKRMQNPQLPDLDWTRDGPAQQRWEAFRTRIREHIVKEEEEQGNFVQHMYRQECIFDSKSRYERDATGDGSG